METHKYLQHRVILNTLKITRTKLNYPIKKYLDPNFFKIWISMVTRFLKKDVFLQNRGNFTGDEVFW